MNGWINRLSETSKTILPALNSLKPTWVYVTLRVSKYMHESSYLHLYGRHAWLLGWEIRAWFLLDGTEGELGSGLSVNPEDVC